MKQDFAGKLITSLTWWLGKKRSFSINNEYQLELLFIDKVNNSAKIRITNLKNGAVVESINQVDSELDYDLNSEL